jgi:FixJ family two-component response regulator
VTQATAIVHVIDDDESLRTALAKLLAVAGYEVRAYSSAGEFLLQDLSSLHGCLLLDLRMPGPNGLELQEALVRRECRLPIVFMSAHGDIPASVRAMKAGAADFLTKPVARPELLAAIAAALAGHYAQSIGAEQRVVLRQRYELLTPREREVFRGIVEGKLNKQIADDLGIALRTVKVHRAQVMEKLGADSPAALGRMAEQLQPGHLTPE